MDGEERTPGDPLSAGIGRLLEAPRRFGFYHAIALLERAVPDAPRVGELGPVAEEGVRFRHDPALVFSTSDVSNVVVRRVPLDQLEGPPHPCYEVTTTFLGLTGVVSPLPVYFSEEVLHEDPDKPTQRDFLDIFHHRILSLCYRIRTRYDYARDYHSQATDAWSRRVLALSGMDVFERPPAGGLPLRLLLRLAPLLATRSRTAGSLCDALRDVLHDELEDAGVTVEQFVGRWVLIEPDQRIRLGLANTSLGRDVTLGARVFDRGGKFRVVLGPLSRQAFRRFLPGAPALSTLRQVVDLVVRDPLDFDVELVLAPGATPPLRLGQVEPARLGLDSWLGVLRDHETRIHVQPPAGTPAPTPPASPSP